MMRTLALSLVAVLLLAGSALAQTTHATLVWNMASAVPDAQGFTYTLKDGTTAIPLLGAVTCTTVATQTQCQAPVTPLVAGPGHSLVLTASNALGSASSTPVTGTVPGAPTGITITVTVTIP